MYETQDLPQPASFAPVMPFAQDHQGLRAGRSEKKVWNCCLAWRSCVDFASDGWSHRWVFRHRRRARVKTRQGCRVAWRMEQASAPSDTPIATKRQSTASQIALGWPVWSHEFRRVRLRHAKHLRLISAPPQVHLCDPGEGRRGAAAHEKNTRAGQRS